MTDYQFPGAIQVRQLKENHADGRFGADSPLTYNEQRYQRSGRPGSLFLATYPKGTSMNNLGLPCSVLYLGLDMSLTYRVAVSPADDQWFDRLSEVINTLFKMGDRARCAWGLSRLMQLTTHSPAMRIGLDNVALEALYQDIDLRDQIGTLLTRYVDSQEGADRLFIEEAFAIWIRRMGRLMQLSPANVLELLRRQLPGVERFLGDVPNYQPHPNAVQLVPGRNAATFDVAPRVGNATQTPFAGAVPQRPAARVEDVDDFLSGVAVPREPDQLSQWLSDRLAAQLDELAELPPSPASQPLRPRPPGRNRRIAHDDDPTTGAH